MVQTLCGSFQERVDYWIFGCPVLAKTELLTGHNNVATYDHQSICRHCNIEIPVMNSNQKQLWKMWKWHGSNSLGCAVDQHWQSSKAQQTWYYYQRPYHQILYLQDITIPSDINGPTKEFEELPKYKDLEIEVSRMWDMKTTTMKHRNKGKLVWTPTKNSGRKWLGNNPLEYANQQRQSSKPRHAT